MKFFLDTAHYESIENALKTGLVDGVTTNPTLLSKEGNDPTELVKKIAALPLDAVSVEVTEHEPEKIYKQAHRIADLGSNIVVKVPCAPQYLSVINKLSSEGVPLNITLVFSMLQGLCMARLGVKYVSPFIGRLDDIDSQGIQVLYDLKEIFSTYEFKTKILAASIRTVSHIHAAALAGVDCATVPLTLFELLTAHPLSEKGIALFERDWQKLPISEFPKNKE
jgi:transaldolase